MCNFFSAVLTRGHKVHAHFGVDSHTDIIEMSGLGHLETLEKIAGGKIGFVRCELTPPEKWDGNGFDSWQFKTDQDVIPGWYDPDKARVAMMDFLKAAPQIGPDETRAIVNGPIWFCFGKITQLVLGGVIRILNWGTVSSNEGIVSSNWGTVSSNWGTVSSNWGTVSSNEGIVSSNWGTVSSNWGKILEGKDKTT